MVTKARQLAEFIANADVDSDEIATGAVSASKLADTLDLSSKTIVMPDVAAFNITSGDVGIGTTSPNSNFVVSDNGGYGFEFIPNNSSLNHVLSYDRANSVYRDYKVSANEVIFGYGQAGANEAMRITSDGKVGIGTTNPLQKLSINGRVSSDLNQDYYGAWFEGNTATNGDSFFAVGSWYSNSAHFEKRTGESYAHIYNYNGGHHLVLQAGSGGSGRASTTAGNVGIGTTSPLTKLHVHSSGSPEIRATTSLDSNTPTMQIGYSSGSGYFLRLGDAANNEDIMLRTYGNSVFNGGNVGIGTTSPSTLYGAYNTPLVVTDPTSGNLPYIEVRSSPSANQAGLIFNRSNTTGWLNALNNDGKLRIAPMASINQTGLTNAKDGSTGITIDTSGNVGINRTDPSYARLHIVNDTSGGNDNFMLMLQNTTTVADSRSGIMFSTNSGQGAGRDGAAIQASNNGIDGRAHITFGNVINNTYEEKVKFTTDGKVGIGTTNPSEKLHVNGGSILATGNIKTSGTGTIGLKHHSNSGITATSNYQAFHTGQTNGWRFDANSTGDATNPVLDIGADGNVRFLDVGGPPSVQPGIYTIKAEDCSWSGDDIHIDIHSVLGRNNLRMAAGTIYINGTNYNSGAAFNHFGAVIHFACGYGTFNSTVIASQSGGGVSISSTNVGSGFMTVRVTVSGNGGSSGSTPIPIYGMVVSGGMQ